MVVLFLGKSMLIRALLILPVLRLVNGAAQAHFLIWHWLIRLTQGAFLA